MKAVRFLGAGLPLQLVDLDRPWPAPGWVVLKVESAGICRSDLHIVRGAQFASRDRQIVAAPPRTLGHEIAGTISAVGDGVTGWALGDAVVAGPNPPGSEAGSPGNTIDGGFAEYCAVPTDALMRIPPGVSYDAAAVATDAIRISYQAVRYQGAAAEGENVVVLGLGGLGLNGVRTASLVGATVYGVDLNESAFPSALEAGARGCATSLAGLGPVPPDLIVDFVGSARTVGAALEAVRPGGRVVVVGLEDTTAPVNVYDLIFGKKTLVGFGGGNRQALSEVLEYLAQGEFAPRTVAVEFTELDAALRRLAELGAPGQRLVTHPHP
jgi:propanol-preferring alcohol dehydrogenase